MKRITYDAERLDILIDGEAQYFSRSEVSLVEYLMRRPGVVRTRDEIMDLLYGVGSATDGRNIDSHIRRIRKKFSKHNLDPIRTRRSFGYVWRKDQND